MFRVANVYFPTHSQVKMFSFLPFASFGEMLGEQSSESKEEGKFNFRNPKFLFYDYMPFRESSVRVWLCWEDEKELAHSWVIGSLPL